MKEKHSLKELRARYNLKQEEIAEIIGISHSRWSNLERDSTNIKINTALKISNFFNVPLELIFFGKLSDISIPDEKGENNASYTHNARRYSS